MCQFLCFSLPKHDFVELLLPERRFYVQGLLILLNRVNKESYALHLSNLKDKSIFKIMKIITLSQFIPLILFERNLSTAALISPLLADPTDRKAVEMLSVLAPLMINNVIVNYAR